MGYSGRYHAASLAAVFVALAIGILIGVGLADDVVSGVSEELEDSLRADLDEANAEVDDLSSQLKVESEFSDAVGPALVAGRLDRERVAMVEFGEVDSARRTRRRPRWRRPVERSHPSRSSGCRPTFPRWRRLAGGRFATLAPGPGARHRPRHLDRPPAGGWRTPGREGQRTALQSVQRKPRRSHPRRRGQPGAG